MSQLGSVSALPHVQSSAFFAALQTCRQSAGQTYKILSSTSLLLGEGMACAFSSLLSNSGPRDTTAWERERNGFVRVKVMI